MTTAAKPPREAKVPFSRSIQAKYALTYLLVVAAILIVMNTYPLLMVENMVFASKESTLKQQALVIGSALAVSETLTQEGVEQTMAVLEKAQGTRVLVADGTGRILYDSSTLDNRLGDYALMGEVVAALRGRDVARSEYREGGIRRRCPCCTTGPPWGRCTSMSTTRSRPRCCCPFSPTCGISPW